MPLTSEVQKALVTKYSDNETGRVEYSQVGDAPAKVEAKGVADFRAGKEMTPKTISGIGSITKQFTAATLIKLWDDELTEHKKDATIPAKFPDGIDTKLSDFMAGLKEKFPQCEELFIKIEGDESYKKITLRDLLNHTHGLGGRDGGKAMLLCVQMINQSSLQTSLTQLVKQYMRDWLLNSMECMITATLVLIWRR